MKQFLGRKTQCLLLFLSAALPSFADDEDLSLESILNLEVTSASKTPEKMNEAPANVIVMTRKDLQQRGYTELSRILDDIPGMDVARSYGDTHFKNYWRGFRNTIGEPFLLMVDGIIMNHLYYNTADSPLVALPISSVERIEIVYGPASSVYGANAFNGVINIITKKDAEKNGVSSNVNVMYGGSSSLAKGAPDRRIVDGQILYKKDDYRVSAAVRYENAGVNSAFINNYEYTNEKYLANKDIWSRYLDYPNLAKPYFKSGVNGRSIDIRAYGGKSEIGFLYNVLDTGYGLHYTFDKYQPDAVWARPELSLHVRHGQELLENLFSTTLIRYRESGVSPDSYSLDAYPIKHFDNAGVDGIKGNSDDVYQKTYGAALSYWGVQNKSVSMYQDFEIKLLDNLNFVAGFKYEQKKLQQAYDNPYGSYYEDANFPLSSKGKVDTSQFTKPAGTVLPAWNFISTEDRGVYAQAKYTFMPKNHLVLGLRNDINSVYGSATTFRGGYVGNQNEFGWKVLYGQAYQEPTPRTLFGGWSGSGSNVNLSPEKSNTLEGSFSYTGKNYAAWLGLYNVQNSDTIVTVAGSATNLGKRTTLGGDLGFNVLMPVNYLKMFKLWGYYSKIFKQEADVFDSAGVKTGTGKIGDLAENKFYLGLTSELSAGHQLTLRSRWLGARDTVSSITIPAYFVMDANVSVSYNKSLSLSLLVNNLFNTEYFHPGLRDANAGSTPGVASAVNYSAQAAAPNTPGAQIPGVKWAGSGSYYNSKLAQPGREFVLQARYEF